MNNLRLIGIKLLSMTWTDRLLDYTKSHFVIFAKSARFDTMTA